MQLSIRQVLLNAKAEQLAMCEVLEKEGYGVSRQNIHEIDALLPLLPMT